MVSITPADRATFRSDLSKARASLEVELEDIYKGFVVVAYNMILDETPQWTGHAAAQWNIGRNHIDVSRSHRYLKDRLSVSQSARDKTTGDTALKHKGDMEAIDEAKRRQSGAVSQIKLADVIFISNNVEDLLTGGYAQKLEENPNSYLREANDPGHMVMRTVEWFNSRLLVLSEADQKKLRLVKLSDSGLMETF